MIKWIKGIFSKNISTVPKYRMITVNKVTIWVKVGE